MRQIISADTSGRKTITNMINRQSNFNTRINKLEDIYKNKLRIAILSNEEFTDSINIIKFMISLNVIDNNIDIVMYDSNTTSAVIELTKLINKGYKYVYGTQGSSDVTSLIDLLNDNIDNIIYFNTYSTVRFNIPLPSNLIRTALIDDELINTIFSFFADNTKLYDLLKIGGYNRLAEPLETSIFSKICYIFEPSVYTSNYLERIMISNSNIGNILEISSFELNNVSEFPEELINLLLSNPVSSENFKSSEKTIFIVNSSTPQNLLNLFNNISYGDNYFLFGDPFFNNNIEVNIFFQYAFIGIGNFSELGYKYSRFIDPNQDISPMGFSLIDLIQYASPILDMNYNKSSNQIIDLLKHIEFIKYSDIYSHDHWFRKNTFLYHIFNNVDNENIFSYELTISNTQYNPNNITISQSNTLCKILKDDINELKEKISILRKKDEYIRSVRYIIDKEDLINTLDNEIHELEDTETNKREALSILPDISGLLVQKNNLQEQINNLQEQINNLQVQINPIQNQINNIDNLNNEINNISISIGSKSNKQHELINSLNNIEMTRDNEIQANNNEIKRYQDDLIKEQENHDNNCKTKSKYNV